MAPLVPALHTATVGGRDRLYWGRRFPSPLRRSRLGRRCRNSSPKAIQRRCRIQPRRISHMEIDLLAGLEQALRCRTPRPEAVIRATTAPTQEVASMLGLLGNGATMCSRAGKTSRVATIRISRALRFPLVASG